MTNRFGIFNIMEADLPYHLRNRNNGESDTSINTITVYPSITRIAGEDLHYGNAVYVHTDGKVYKSSYVHPASAFVLSNCITSQLVEIVTNGSDSILQIPDVNFDIGKKVWLCAGQPNLTTDVPDFAQNNYIQQLGIAISTDEILINIEESYKVL